MALVCEVGGLGSLVLTWFSFCPHPLSLTCSHPLWALVPLLLTCLAYTYCWPESLTARALPPLVGSSRHSLGTCCLHLKHLGPFGGMVLGWHTSCVLHNICHHDQLFNLGRWCQLHLLGGGGGLKCLHRPLSSSIRQGVTRGINVYLTVLTSVSQPTLHLCVCVSTPLPPPTPLPLLPPLFPSFLDTILNAPHFLTCSS